jgi:hypothetical protein
MRTAPWVAGAALGLALSGCRTPPVREIMPPPPAAAMQVITSAPVVLAPEPAPAPEPAAACVPRTLAPPPKYPDSDAALKAAPGAADRYQLMAAGRMLRQKRLEELERVVAGCR